MPARALVTSKGSAAAAGKTCSAGLAELQQLGDAPGLSQHGWISSRMRAYRVNSPPQAISCAPPAGRGAAEEVKIGGAVRGRNSLICAPFELGKKICPRN